MTSTTPLPDVTVVGAGMVGTATALALAEAGLRVHLVEGDFAGGGSTGAAMGHVVAMDDSPAQLTFCAHSIARWRAVADTLPSAGEMDWCGTLWLAVDEAEMANGAERVRGYRSAGIEAELLDARALRDLEPHLGPGLAGALLVPRDGVCYPPAIARALTERVAMQGGIVRQHQPVGVIEAGRVRLQSGEVISTGAIVVAAGVQSPLLVRGLPIVPRRGHLVITDRHPGMVRHQLVELGYLASAHTFGGASVAFNVQPRRNGQLLIGSSRELVGFAGGVNRPLLHQMLQRAERFVPALKGTRALRTWTGFRPATADKLPLIGRWPAQENLWIAAGHEGLGITMSFGTADLIVAGILGTTPPFDPIPYRPDRPMPRLEQAA